MTKINLDTIFVDLTFTDIFETFDDEYLIKMIQQDPKQLHRMCIFLSLDMQLMEEKSLKPQPQEDLN